MSTIYAPADAWDALSADGRQAVIDSAMIPVMLGTPAELHGTFVDDGDTTTFALDTDDPPTDPRWYAWDDGRLTEEHALAVAAALGV